MSTTWTDQEVKTPALKVAEITDEAGTGAPSFPQGIGISPGAIPLGAIIPIDDRWANVQVPATGTIDAYGMQWCDGQPLGTGELLGAGPTNVPDLTDGRFLRGALPVGATAGADNVTLITDNLPSHSHNITDPGHEHGAGGYATSLSGTFASSGHQHASGSLGAHIAVAGLPGELRWQSGTGTFTSTLRWPSGGNVEVDSTGSIGKTAISGNTASPTASSSLSGSNSVSGTSSSQTTGISIGNTGSGTSFGIIPKYFNVKFLIRVR